MQHLPSKNSVTGFWRMCMCVSKHNVHSGVQEKKVRWLPETLLSRRKVQNLHHLGVNSSLTSTQGTEADREAMSWNSSSFGLISPPTHSLCVTKISIRRGGEGDGYFLFQDRHWCSQILPRLPSAHRHDLSSLWLPAVPPLPLHWAVPTTRWRRVFCSGNSVCRTHCWPSEVLWLFQRLLEASGPTAGVFYHPSRLGTSSGSWDKTGGRKRMLKQKHVHVCCWKRSGRNPFFQEYD